MILEKPVLSIGLLSMMSIWASIAQGEAFTSDSLPKINGVAAYSASSMQLHAATDKGLYVSRDNGYTWRLSYPFRLPATMIAATDGNTIFAFVAGKGLLRIRGAEPMWTPISNQLGAQVLTQLSAPSENTDRLIGLNQFGRLISSTDGGKNWERLSNSHKPDTDAEKRGAKLFVVHCQSCHGVEGVGETYTLESLTNKDYIQAPALDDSAHAWHHTDEALVEMILNGSNRTERMPAGRKQGLNKQHAKDLVSYMKSLWGNRALECQGPKHMQCM